MCGTRMASTTPRPARRPTAASGPPGRRGSRHARTTRLAAARRGRRGRVRRRRRRRRRRDDPRREAAQEFTEAWARGDYVDMHALLTPAAQQRVPLERFGEAYRRAARVATLSGVTAGSPDDPSGGAVAVPVVMRTRIFGTLSGQVDAAGRRDRGRRGDRLAPVPRPPRAAAWRVAHAQYHDAAARGDPGARRHAARGGRGAAVGARRARVRDRRPRRARAARARGRAGAARRPARRAGRADRAGARVRRRALRPTRRRAARRRPRARVGRAEAGPRRAHDDRPGDPARGRDRARRRATAASP